METKGERERQELKEGRCGYWLPMKNRYCRVVPDFEGEKYCTNHSQQLQGKRINCPLDPTHFVLESDLEKHITIKCPLLVHLKELEASGYYRKDINAISPQMSQPKSDAKEPSVIPKTPLPQLQDLMARIRQKAQEFINDSIPEISYMEHPSLDHIEGSIKIKHRKQEVSISEHMRLLDLLHADNRFVEFGCGKAKLSNFLYQEMNGGKFVLIDKRQNFRSKVDGTFKHPEAFKRISIDIKDLYVPGIGDLTPVNSDTDTDTDMVCYSKHLCGGAADLTLRSLENCRVKAILIANCCHSACTLSSYIDPSYILQDLQFSPQDFEIMTSMCGWAVGSPTDDKVYKSKRPKVRKSKDGQPMPAIEPKGDGGDIGAGGISTSERREIGFLAKRLLDVGRMRYLRKKGMDAKLVYYVPRDVSPENCLLIAHWPSDASNRDSDKTEI
eukprot:TRINITY_DN7724_c0_g1_i2.p1 TRINITY_DN7724_c0_g1~~TRINITY_DN7724_c0_g1_i2.p1  ORF type:complete len:442 (+),score=130.85 TRINITY_DN7724_c0_g1_i2:289-1614(+)